MRAYWAMWKNYFNFYEQTSLRSYWIATLINFIVSLVITAIVEAIPALALIAKIYSVAVLIPGTAMTIRRLRDAGHRWTSIFIVLIPMVGIIILLIWLCQPTSTWLREQV